jgi:hypothetical protein
MLALSSELFVNVSSKKKPVKMSHLSSYIVSKRSVWQKGKVLTDPAKREWFLQSELASFDSIDRCLVANK